MKKKIIASISIFVLLFCLAWSLDKKDQHQFYVPDEEVETVEFMSTHSDTKDVQKRRLKVFKAREYVRIELP